MMAETSDLFSQLINSSPFPNNNYLIDFLKGMMVSDKGYLEIEFDGAKLKRML